MTLEEFARIASGHDTAIAREALRAAAQATACGSRHGWQGGGGRKRRRPARSAKR